MNRLGVLRFAFKNFLFVGLVASTASAVPLQLGQPVLEGSACGNGTARAATTDDGSAVSLLFDRFMTEASAGFNPLSKIRQYCHVKIPIQMDPGYKLQVTQITYRGFVNLPAGHTGGVFTTGPLVNAQSFLITGSTPRTTWVNLQGNVEANQPIAQNAAMSCGGAGFLDFTTLIQLFGPNPRNTSVFSAPASLTIDSSDIGGVNDDIRLLFRVVRCS